MIGTFRIWWRYYTKRQSLTRQGVVPSWVERTGVSEPCIIRPGDVISKKDRGARRK